jgi:SAM-dependent methyltransferase
VDIANAEQAEHWNSVEELRHWVDLQARYDTMLGPFATLLLDAARISSGETVLDVGCGCGATTRSAALFAAPGEVLGVDLSAAMLERGRADADTAGLSNVSFLQADAQVQALGSDRFDVVISRFGVMFFEDPIAAFANIGAATRPGGRLVFVCWRPLIENAWLLVPGAALTEFVRLPDAGASDAPGMFAFSDPTRVHSVLSSAGWSDVDVRAVDTTMLLGGGGTVDETVEFLRTGTTGQSLLEGADAATEAKALDAVADALAPYADDAGVHLGAAVWVVSATA